MICPPPRARQATKIAVMIVSHRGEVGLIVGPVLLFSIYMLFWRVFARGRDAKRMRAELTLAQSTAFGGPEVTPPSVFIYIIFRSSQPHRSRRVEIRIGVNRSAFGGTVPHFHQMSREISRCPAFFENGIIIFFVADYSTCLPRNATK